MIDRIVIFGIWMWWSWGKMRLDWSMTTIRKCECGFHLDCEWSWTDFFCRFTNDLYNIGLNLGSSLSGKELTVELYKFNESLTRLLSQQSNLPRDPSIEFLNGDLRTINSDEETIHDQGATRLKIDSTLLIKTIIKLLILKLSKIIEILSSSQVKLSNIEHKLIDDILMKNISNRILKPYHNLIHLKTGSIMSNVY